jgi:hypothetical protein
MVSGEENQRPKEKTKTVAALTAAGDATSDLIRRK